MNGLTGTCFVGSLLFHQKSRRCTHVSRDGTGAFALVRQLAGSFVSTVKKKLHLSLPDSANRLDESCKLILPDADESFEVCLIEAVS